MGPDIADGTTNAFMRPEPGNRPSRAYVTFLPGNGDYVKGVIGLAERLREVRSKYQLVVAILPEMPEDHWQMLVDRGCIVKEIELVYPLENQTQFAKAYYVRNYSKLRIWEVALGFFEYLFSTLKFLSSLTPLGQTHLERARW
ncbi:hypothetical protein ACJRO7_010980 [Eucalyptus globulus]|uniref:Hexosyltransferase n=1 Tax=Eucalyptus globulus TaxID=34317 RepID=A0ABD3LIC1_EUCGL